MVEDRKVIEKMALESKKVQRFLSEKSVKKTIYIPGKIISLVISS